LEWEPNASIEKAEMVRIVSFFYDLGFDDFLKSRRSGESRNPENLSWFSAAGSNN
jgi:hypothetical protein